MYGLVFSKNDQISPPFTIEKFVPLKFTIEELTCVVSSVILTVIFTRALIFVLLLCGATHLFKVGASLSFFAPGVNVVRLKMLDIPSGYLAIAMFSCVEDCT